MIYVNDWENYLPPAIYGDKLCHTILRENGYIGSSDLVRNKGCNAQRPFDSDTTSATEEQRSHIGYNCLLGDIKANGTANTWAGYDKIMVQLTSVKSPSHKVMWIDSAYKSEVCILRRQNSVSADDATKNNQWSGAAYIHNGAVNICWIDGHASPLRFGQEKYRGADFNAPTWEKGDCGYYFTPTIAGQ